MSVRFQISSMIRGYHEYEHIWDAVVGETLPCNYEVRNVHDPCAVNVVGHNAKKAFMLVLNVFATGW